MARLVGRLPTGRDGLCGEQAISTASALLRDAFTCGRPRCLVVRLVGQPAWPAFANTRARAMSAADIQSCPFTMNKI